MAGKPYAKYIRRAVGGTAIVLVPSCSYVAYKYRPRASFDVDYHETLVGARSDADSFALAYTPAFATPPWYRRQLAGRRTSGAWMTSIGQCRFDAVQLFHEVISYHCLLNIYGTA